MTTPLHQLADKLHASGNRALLVRQTLKRTLLWTWRQLSHEDRQTFLDHIEYPSLMFVTVRKITGDTDIDAKLWQVRSMIDHFEGADKQFLQSLLNRMSVTGCQLSEKQVAWFLRLFKQYKRDIDRLLVEAGVELEELEVTE